MLQQLQLQRYPAGGTERSRFEFDDRRPADSRPHPLRRRRDVTTGWMFPLHPTIIAARFSSVWSMTSSITGSSIRDIVLATLSLGSAR
jgi:hypothetical protein